MMKRPDSPWLWLAGTWVIAISFWLATPQHVVEIYFPKGRYWSLTATLYLTLFLGTLSFGYFFGKNRRAHPARRMLLPAAMNNRVIALATLKAIKLPILVAVLLGLFGTALHVLETGQVYDISRYSVTDVSGLRVGYYSSRIKGLTILKFCSLAGFLLCVLGVHISRRWNARKEERVLRFYQGLALLVPVVGLFLGTRSYSLLWLIPYAYVKLALTLRYPNTASRANARRRLSMAIRYAAVTAAAVAVLFAMGEYQRQYARMQTRELDMQSVIGTRDAGFTSFAFYHLSSYFFRCVNNGLVLVDHLEGHTYVWRTFRWAYTGTGLEDADPGGLIAGVRTEMRQMQRRGYGYFARSNSSLPGYLFIDLGWFAIGLAWALGYALGALYRRLSHGDLTAWLVLPIVMFGVVESWQSDIVFRSFVAVPIIFAFVSSRFVAARVDTYSRRHARSVS